jgi:kojibiose phosphorylase
MQLQAVIFDFDGVLCATVEHHYQSWKRVTEEYDIPFDRKDNDRLLGLTRHKSLETILGGRSIPKDQFVEILERKNEYYLELIDGMSQADLLPGVLELLQELKSADVKTAVASASRNAATVVRRLGIESLMDAVVDGTTVHRSKPAPDVYLHAIHVLGIQQCAGIAVEDSQAGIRAAQAAGLCAIGLGQEQLLRQADAVFPGLLDVHLPDLLAVFRGWQAGCRMMDIASD